MEGPLGTQVTSFLLYLLSPAGSWEEAWPLAVLWGDTLGAGEHLFVREAWNEPCLYLATKMLGPHRDRLHPQLYPNALSSEGRVTAVSKAPRCPSTLEQAKGWYKGWYKGADSSNLAFLRTNTASSCQTLHKVPYGGCSTARVLGIHQGCLKHRWPQGNGNSRATERSRRSCPSP